MLLAELAGLVRNGDISRAHKKRDEFERALHASIDQTIAFFRLCAADILELRSGRLKEQVEHLIAHGSDGGLSAEDVDTMADLVGLIEELEGLVDFVIVNREAVRKIIKKQVKVSALLRTPPVGSGPADSSLALDHPLVDSLHRQLTELRTLQKKVAFKSVSYAAHMNKRSARGTGCASEVLLSARQKACGRKIPADSSRAAHHHHQDPRSHQCHPSSSSFVARVRRMRTGFRRKATSSQPVRSSALDGAILIQAGTRGAVTDCSSSPRRWSAALVPASQHGLGHRQSSFRKQPVDPALICAMERTFLSALNHAFYMMLLATGLMSINDYDEMPFCLGAAVFVCAVIYAVLSYFVHWRRLHNLAMQRTITTTESLTWLGALCVLVVIVSVLDLVFIFRYPVLDRAKAVELITS